MPADLVAIQALLERLTLVTLLGWLVIGFMRSWIAPGSAVEQLRQEIVDWKQRHDRIAAIAEGALRQRVGQ